MNIRSFVAWHAPMPVGPLPRLEPTWTEWHGGNTRLRFESRHTTPASQHPGASAAGPALMLGDDSDFDPAVPSASLAHGTSIRFDRETGALSICTSIVALPPVFVFRGPQVTVVASDLHVLARLPGVRLQLDPRGVAELGRFGHPVGHRTLFGNVEVVPGGMTCRLSSSGNVAWEKNWELPPASVRLDWSEYLEAQIAAFEQQVASMDVDSAFLSLTAGLDTRTVFAALAAADRLVPAVTMTGPTWSLDARIAARLCRAYGVRHNAIVFDQHFTRELPRLLETASRLSGGLASLDQAPEVFLYEQFGQSFRSRLSGNLGNQVGRGGTEGVSLRGADLSMLGPLLQEAVPSRGHWLLEQLDKDERSSMHFILQQEIPFTLMSNFCVGSHFAAQKTPYASRKLIETLALRPAASGGAPSGSKFRMRLRDLRHRFVGEPEDRSFQRTLVRRLNGYAARCPVNWGWRPTGGVSITGVATGFATFAGMFARASGLDNGILRLPLRWTGLPALHDFRESRRWLQSDLRDYVRDTLLSAELRHAGLFNRPLLEAVVEEHLTRRRDHHHSVTFALDVALAFRSFCH